jgi:hypothetical protein
MPYWAACCWLVASAVAFKALTRPRAPDEPISPAWCVAVFLVALSTALALFRVAMVRPPASWLRDASKKSPEAEDPADHRD